MRLLGKLQGLHPTFLPLSFPQGQTCIMDWWFSQSFLAPSKLSLRVISSNKVLAYLILSWHLLLVLTQLSNPNADLDLVDLRKSEILHA
jgi:hypothetical protein